MKDLESIAQVTEDRRGVVITMAGNTLFTFGNAALLETAKMRLDQVADALKAQGAEKRIMVEGHTDNAGSVAINQPLSENRANAVRAYLISAGVEPGRISAVGFGGSRPITDNDTVENRAKNRRIEIVIENGSISAL
jgi:outer membrane protein OmpA-like peptidoglycan-associated protein